MEIECKIRDAKDKEEVLKICKECGRYKICKTVEIFGIEKEIEKI